MFGQCGKDAAYLELEQLHKQSCFTPIHVKDMMAEEKQQAQQHYENFHPNFDLGMHSQGLIRENPRSH